MNECPWSTLEGSDGHHFQTSLKQGSTLTATVLRMLLAEDSTLKLPRMVQVKLLWAVAWGI